MSSKKSTPKGTTKSVEGGGDTPSRNEKAPTPKRTLFGAITSVLKGKDTGDKVTEGSESEEFVSGDEGVADKSDCYDINTAFKQPALGLVGPKRQGQSSDSEEETSQNESANDTGSRVEDTESDLPHKSGNDEIHSRSVEKKSRRKIAQEKKKEKSLEFIANAKRRTDTAKERGGTLQEKAKEMKALTGAKVYLKAEYTSEKDRVYTYTFGNDFSLAGEKVSPAKKDSIQAMIDKAVDDGFKRNFANQPSAFSSGRYFTPEVADRTPTTSHGKKSKRPDACVLCFSSLGSMEVIDHNGQVTKAYETPLLACSHKGDKGAFCPRAVHLDCLGFTGLTDKDIEKMPDWYCKLHMSDARAEKGIVLLDDSASSQKNKRAKKDLGKSKKKPETESDEESPQTSRSMKSQKKKQTEKSKVKAKK